MFEVEKNKIGQEKNKIDLKNYSGASAREARAAESHE